MPQIALIGIVVVVPLVAVLWAAGVYNSLVTLRNRYKNAFLQIDVQLKRRYDLIPNLVESVRGVLKYETETLEAVIRARGAAFAANQNAVITEIKSETPETKAGRRNRKSDEDTIKEIINLANSLLDTVDDEPSEQEEGNNEEVGSNVNEASEELTANDNSEKSKSLLERINKIKEAIDL